MAQLRIALAQVNSTVGDLSANADLVVEQTQAARAAGAQLVAFPEMVLTGYPAEDLVLRRSFIDASLATLQSLAKRLAVAGCGGIAVVVGYLDRCPHSTPRVGRPAGEPQNAAAFLYDGKVVAKYAKHHLPNYGVFDEFRYFVPGDVFPVVRLNGVDIAMCICEDLWQEGGPARVACEAGADVLVCINGSPYERTKADFRLELLQERAAEAGAPIAYVNMVGGQDELVFDGDSLVVAADGSLLARAAQFAEELLVTDLDLPVHRSNRAGSADAGDRTSMAIERHVVSADPMPAYQPKPAHIADRLDELAEVYAALVTGTRDYVRKNRFRSVVLGLSGGIDSALVATIAADAIGAENVNAIALPSKFSSEHSLEDALDLADRQGVGFSVVPIGKVVEAYDAVLAESGGVDGIAAENLQARVRGTLLMALSNQHGHLVLTTGNKSEIATGYSTLYGDSAGGFAPIKDILKTMVWELARWRNRSAEQRGEKPPIPERSIAKPPSAELAPGQLDADRLPEYDVLDAVLHDYVDRDLGHDALVTAGHDAEIVERVIRLVDAAEYKRRQYPPGPKVSLKAFGRDRRLPITNAWRGQATTATEPETVRPEGR